MSDWNSKHTNENGFFLGDLERSSQEDPKQKAKRKPLRAIKDLSQKEAKKEKALRRKKPLHAKRDLVEK